MDDAVFTFGKDQASLAATNAVTRMNRERVFQYRGIALHTILPGVGKGGKKGNLKPVLQIVADFPVMPSCLFGGLLFYAMKTSALVVSV